MWHRGRRVRTPGGSIVPFAASSGTGGLARDPRQPVRWMLVHAVRRVQHRATSTLSPIVDESSLSDYTIPASNSVAEGR
jgi:hypothetical protein